jgi:hypothetical protein
MYLDSVEEVLSFHDGIDEPHEYVKQTPRLFNKWAEWAKSYKSKDEDTMRPFGVKTGPDWMKSEFDCLDTFYKFYIDILQNDNG